MMTYNAPMVIPKPKQIVARKRMIPYTTFLSVSLNILDMSSSVSKKVYSWADYTPIGQEVMSYDGGDCYLNGCEGVRPWYRYPSVGYVVVWMNYALYLL